MMQKYFNNLSERAEEKQRICETYAQKYYPKGNIKLLIVGESPPIGKSYFYIPESLNKRYHSFPAKIFRGLFSADTKISELECERYLKKFQKCNYLITDLVTFPIDCFASSIRAEIIESEFQNLKIRLTSLKLSKKCHKVLVLPSGTRKELKKKRYSCIIDDLEDSGFGLIKWSELEEHLLSIQKI